MSILENIIAAKRIEVGVQKQNVSVRKLEGRKFFDRACISLSQSLNLTPTSGIIAEFKRRSPSRGIFKAEAKTSVICLDYQAAGASALSILTDYDYFGGSLADIEEVRAQIKIPILRKDFTVDEYQILEAKSYGADLILLIAAVLSEKECLQLSSFAKSLGLEVLLEVHSKEELLKYCNDDIALLGVNNRDLKTFETNIELSKDLAKFIPNQYVKIAESGLSSPTEIQELRSCGYKGFLIGESFMKEENPGATCAAWVGAVG